ncbi:hypothetical protein [Caryophanon latum]|uniref:Uncharacterized protein n=1 Tax=Caryophanon latum TaxID=33977 RepID=A0A1C0YB80_9BACL|nr:hypothetical protein [Caryophanon latum]OCS84456.1 hypothetical protein A6K76_15600 [Caryophanon latum]
MTASVMAAIVGVIVGLIGNKKYVRSTAIIIWGVVTLVLFSWSFMMISGYVAANIVQEGLIIASFLMFGTPIIAVIGIVLILSGIVQKRT